ncbi:MAG: LON peptidase substrate-binding domain-containing protein [Burkholderiales bacterium]
MPTQIPLFPLGTVLFPDGLLSLQVFEVRYLDMIGKCQKAEAPFGVVLLTRGTEVRKPDATEEFRPVGTLATIESVQSVQPGLLTVRCIGSQRFRIDRSARQPHGLWTAEVQTIAGDGKVPVPDDLLSTSDALGRLLEALRERQDGTHPLPIAEPLELGDCGWVSNRWCELLPMAPATRQRLMELDNPLVRLELVSDLLSKNGIVPSA